MNYSYKDFKLRLICEKVNKLDPEKNILYQDFDDVAAGTLYCDVFSPVLRYCKGSRTWWIYDGTVWREDVNQQAEYFGQLLARAMWLYASDHGKASTEFAVRLKKNHTRMTMLKDASALPELSLDRADLDQHPQLINLKNGVFNLETLELQDHDPALLLSKCAGVEYVPDAEQDELRKFITEVCCGNQDLIRYLQKLCGLLLTTDTYLNEFYILYGPLSRNGKSTLIETIAAMLGSYSANAEPETLAQKKKDSRQASPDLARLQGIRFLSVSEAPKSMLFDSALIKKLTGNDMLTARMLHENPVEFMPVFKMIMGSNYLPATNDPTLFSSDRVRIIPFNRHFSPDEQDKGLKTRLRSPGNLAALFNWAVEGLGLFRDEGLEPPPAVLESTESYRASSDKLALFFEEKCEEDVSFKSPVSKLYPAYEAWCHSSGYRAEGKQSFCQSLRTKGILSNTATVDGVTLHNVVCGYRLITDTTEDFPV